MRKTVCKRLRKQAAAIAPETKYTLKQKIKSYFTGKVDDKGQRVIRDVTKSTLVYAGFRRVSRDLKRDYRKRKAA